MPRAKETSDVISPPLVETARVVVAPGSRRAGDYFALALATCGVGLIPLAPGTWGAAVGVGTYLAVLKLAETAFVRGGARGLQASSTSFQALLTTLLLAFVFAVSIVGTWAATRAEKLLGKKDPGAVVVDEVAGQLVAFLFVPWGAGWWTLASAFVAFRLFDIWKPYPIRRLEGLGGGLGIMADDLLAGFYAATLVSLLNSIQIFY
ncbi:MAG TPA: phosphatidylglycerophosphatase A [Pyrinomonadaceae bacterium]|jgi:phosphatidylglycerophosphatase A|nr:phosphatidylglycerophosphatase A [Pyrinomonadaceae bacterium]